MPGLFEGSNHDHDRNRFAVREAITFTDAQRALIEATSSTYVSACPGAGKTQAIVQRFVERPAIVPRLGIALLSFANAAVDEAISRCAGKPELLHSPNFVGTIDAFINRFIVGPVFLQRRGIRPHFSSSWAHVTNTLVSAKGVRLQAPLDWFTFTIDGSAVLDRAPWDKKTMVEKLTQSHREKLENRAGQRWASYTRRGIFDSAAARLVMDFYLDLPDVQAALVDLLSARFCEVIVDEVQDCSEEDVKLLKFLLSAGIRLVMVGDSDQAIYGFRGSSPEGLNDLVEGVAVGQRLNGNFRSSPAICSAVDSLRFGTDRDVPVGKNASDAGPVHLVAFDKPVDLHAKIGDILDATGHLKEDVVFLAHGTSTARTHAGESTLSKPGNGKLARFAAAVHTVQDASNTNRVRAEGLRRLEMIVLEFAGFSEDRDIDDYLRPRGLTARSFRESCLRLAMNLEDPYRSTPATFKEALKQQTASRKLLSWNLDGIPARSDAWPVRSTVVKTTNYVHSTVHGYKGLQAPGVVLVIPKPSPSMADNEHGVTQWSCSDQGEARRVLYVGASRAEQLLIIAAHAAVHDAVAKNLTADDVNFVQS